jgi:hypothetical protein
MDRAAARIDWGCLRGALSRFALLLALAAAAYGGSTALGARATADRAERLRTLAAAREHYLQTAGASEALATYRERLQSYRARGLVDGENRLAWLEQLQEASRALELPSLRYTLAAQHPFRPTAVPAVGEGTTASEMTLRVTLRHEGELIALLRRLHDGAHGLVWTRACDLRRPPTSGEPAPLEAECTLLWLTVDTTVGGQR